MIYLNNAATSYPKPDTVVEKVYKSLKSIPLSDGRSSIDSQVLDIADKARNLVASFLGAADSRRFFLLSSATDAANRIVHGLNLAGKKVAVTSLEHNCILRPLFSSMNSEDIHVVFPEGDSLITTKEISDCKDCHCLFLNHCSNVTGSVQNSSELIDTAHKLGMKVIVDLSQAAGISELNLEELNPDMAFCAGHKGLLGVPGVGILYVRDYGALHPSVFGGTGGTKGNLLDMRNSEVFEVGTSNQISLLSMISGIEFIMAHGMKTVADAVSAKVEKIKYSLAEMNHLKLLSPLGQRTGNAVSFNIDGLLPSDVASILLDSFGIIVRSGLMCSPFAFGRGFPAGAVRVSPAFLTPDSDIDAFISAMREIDRGL